MKTETKKSHLHLDLPSEAHQRLRVASVIQKITITQLVTDFAMGLRPEKLLQEEQNEKPEHRDFASG